jgi:nucleosome assembly protein 1-like 1
VSGKAKATSAEIAAGEEVSAKDDDEYTKLPSDSDETAPIPEFWLTALRNHQGISELITDRDADALKHLTDIKVTYGAPDSRLGFTLTFYFEANEYFSNAQLTKSYIYKVWSPWIPFSVELTVALQDEIGYGGDFMYDRAIGSTINWKEDKDLTKEVEIKKQRNKNTNRTRVIRKTRPTDSFFNFFSPPEPPKVDEEDEEDVDEEAIAELEDRLELDYQIGEDIKERVCAPIVMI